MSERLSIGREAFVSLSSMLIDFSGLVEGFSSPPHEVW